MLFIVAFTVSIGMVVLTKMLPLDVDMVNVLIKCLVILLWIYSIFFLGASFAFIIADREYRHEQNTENQERCY